MRNLNFARSVRISLALAVALLGPGLVAAYADATENFTGTLADGVGTFSGSVTVDTTNGATPGANGGNGEVITGGSVTIDGEGGADGLYGTGSSQYEANYGFIYLFQDSHTGGAGGAPFIDLAFTETDPISGYSICTLTANSCGFTSYFAPFNDPDGDSIIDVESATDPPASAPEPGTTALLACGLLGVGMLFAKRRAVLG
jgi:hypothetical protein